MTAADPRIVLVETAPALPGLLPFQAWQVLDRAEVVLVRDAEAHPAAPHLAVAGLDVHTLEPADLPVGGMDLMQPGSPGDRRLARALCDAAEEQGEVVFLLDADDDPLARATGLEAAKRHVEVEFVFLVQQPTGTELLRLVEVEQRLRDPEGGCPWDLEQDHASLARYLIEETYELLDAIDRESDQDLVEELGDVLLQVVFHAQIAADRRAFTIDDVARGIADKLVRRHPHVFGDVEVADADEVATNWDELKRQEKGRQGPFEGVPMALPALQLHHKLQRRAVKLGFDWPDVDAAAAKVREELEEVVAAADGGPHDPAEDAGQDPGVDSEEALEHEVGDLVGAVVALGRVLGVDTERAARRAAARFRTRFEGLLDLARQRDVDLDALDSEGWLSLWAEARARHG